MESRTGLNVVCVGCLHGSLDLLYNTVKVIEETSNVPIDLVLVNGDFQALRSEADLESLACPVKYKSMGDFQHYWKGIKKAPYLTIFIGGNHEASHYLATLHYGGWVADNIYYLGRCGVVNVGGFRIAGISGIYNANDFRKGYFEILPLNENGKRTIYHQREYEALKFSLLSGKIDIIMSHDWPSVIVKQGNYQDLIARKPFLRNEIKEETLGNPITGFLLKRLQPSLWLSAHMHAEYRASAKNADGSQVEFIALDKPLPKRVWIKAFRLEKDSQGLAITEIRWKDSSCMLRDIKPDVGSKPSEEAKIPKPLEVYYDLEWMAITKVTQPLMSMKFNVDYFGLLSALPGYSEYGFFQGQPTKWNVSYAELKTSIEAEKARLKEVIKGNIVFPMSTKEENNCNEQTQQFMDLLGISSRLYEKAKEKKDETAKEIDIADFC